VEDDGADGGCFDDGEQRMWWNLFGISKKWEKQKDVNCKEKKCGDETGKQFEASLLLRGL
jgi:hypothetical protein